jgi:hypothetical protein
VEILMATPPIDRDKLRVFVRQLDGEDLLVLLDRAIDLLPKTKLPKLIKDYARPTDLRPDRDSATGLLAAVRRFHQESLKGRYYEDFNVNSKNYREKSRGTQTWIAECHRLLDLCVAASTTGDLVETRTTFELIFNLLFEINECRVDIIFFADEHGAWQVGVHWREVMPAWFRCLAASTEPDDYARLVHAMISYYAHWETKQLIPAALALANADQAAALAALPPPSKSYSQPTFLS